MIFYRCTGQGNVKIGSNLFDRFCCFRGGIFDKLCFINDLVGEGQLLIQFNIPAEQIIGCDEMAPFWWCSSTDFRSSTFPATV